MPIYTGNGDAGESSLLSGTKLPKDHPVFEALGSIDELNAHIDLLVSNIDDKKLLEFLGSISVVLGEILSILVKVAVRRLGGEGHDAGQLNTSISQLETEIDRLEDELPPVDRFIRFNREPVSAQANICRTICRRAERSIVKLHREISLPEQVLRFMNRLSDYFFMAAVYFDHISA